MKIIYENTPTQILNLYRLSRLSLVLFFSFQIGGIYVLYKKLTSVRAKLDIDSLITQLSNPNSSLSGIQIPQFQMSGFEEFLSGAAISITSGFWLVVAWSGIGLLKPYSHRAYRSLTWSFLFQLFFFILSFSVFLGRTNPL